MLKYKAGNLCHIHVLEYCHMDDHKWLLPDLHAKESTLQKLESRRTSLGLYGDTSVSIWVELSKSHECAVALISRIYI